MTDGEMSHLTITAYDFGLACNQNPLLNKNAKKTTLPVTSVAEFPAMLLGK